MPEEKPDQVIDLETIGLIHRHDDGVITFAKKFDGQWRHLAGLTRKGLIECLPRIMPYLVQDAYFTVNASYQAAPWKNSITGLPGGWCREIYLRYLNACFVDLDCYKFGLQFGDAVNQVIKAQDANVIPPASIIVRSGRGLYLLWLLRGEGRNFERAFPQTIPLYKDVLRAIRERIREFNPALNPDPAAGRTTQLLRIPGSINTKAELPVVAQIQVIQGGVVPVYTLKDLAKLFDVWAAPELPQRTSDYLSGSGRVVQRPGSCPARRSGRIKSGHYRLTDLHTIAVNQAKIKQGKRGMALMYYCEFAKAAEYDLQATIRGMETFARELCSPPYPSDADDTPVREIVRDIFGKGIKRFKSASIARFFEVAPAQARSWGLISIVPWAIRDERKKAKVRDTKRDARREVIWRIVQEHPGAVPSYRRVARRLKQEGLGTVSYRTIGKDLRAVIAKYRDKVNIR